MTTIKLTNSEITEFTQSHATYQCCEDIKFETGIKIQGDSITLDGRKRVVIFYVDYDMKDDWICINIDHTKKFRMSNLNIIYVEKENISFIESYGIKFNGYIINSNNSSSHTIIQPDKDRTILRDRRLYGILNQKDTDNTLQNLTIEGSEKVVLENNIYFASRAPHKNNIFWVGNFTKGTLRDGILRIQIYFRSFPEFNDIGSICIMGSSMTECINILNNDDFFNEYLQLGNLSLLDPPDTIFYGRWKPLYSSEELLAYHKIFLAHRKNILEELQHVSEQFNIREAEFTQIPSEYDKENGRYKHTIQQVMTQTQQPRNIAILALKRFENLFDAVFILTSHDWEDPEDECHNYTFQKQQFL